MRKLIFTALIAFLTVALYAQKIEDVKDLIGKKDWDKAKEKIDAFLANPKNAQTPEGWYYKGVIYNELAKKDSSNSLSFDGRMEAFNALKKYQELDPKNILMILEQNVRLFDIYNGYFDIGAKNFNTKNYNEAYKNFKNASIIEDYIVMKGFEYNSFKFPKMDTSLIQNIALSALLAKNEDAAAEYYKKLADEKISGQGYLEIYQFLVEYYGKKNDIATRNKYVEIGKQLYPENAYWLQVELNEAGDDKQKLFAKYDEIIAKNSTNYVIHFNYGAELFNYLYTQEKKPADYAAQQVKLESVLKKALAIQSTSESNLLMARHLYNMVYDLQDAQAAIKGTKPEDVKKRAAIKAQMNSRLDMMLPYATASYDFFDKKTSLKGSEKGNFKVATDLILRYWEQKGDKVKMKQYQDKMKAIDTL